MFEGYGTLRYRNTWLVVDVNDEIGKYYRHLANIANRMLELNMPMYQSHISVIAGKRYENPNQDLWGKYENEIITFEYDPHVVQDGVYFWMRVYCDRIEDIREELGLPRQIPVPWHITIGNLKNI